MIPQIIFVALMIKGTLDHAEKNGQPKTGKYDLTSAIFADIILIGLLYWGGFFDKH